ncbi:MAG: hypothetical protein AAFX06_15105 [Planctomycetota bacterium]
MIRDLVCNLDYSIVAEVALPLFVGTFALIFYGAIRLSRQATDRFASIPLHDEIKDPIQ